jgi:hypothetical protein
MERLWPILNVVGPLLLIAVIIWVTLANRKARPGEIEKAEQGARDLRRQLEGEEARDGRL